MAHIHIEREHHRDPEEARREVEAIVEELAERLHADFQWQGQTVHFQRKGAQGTLTLEPGRIVIDIRLGLALRALRGQIARRIEEHLDHLGH